MTNEIQKTNPKLTFRGIAADRFRAAADMTLHDLVDEFFRLNALIDAGTTRNEDTGWKVSDDAKVAQNERNIVNGACRARFGISMEPWGSDYDQSF